MEIKNITEHIWYHVETNEYDYRTDGNDNWEFRIGDSWETLNDSSEIQKLYNLYLESNDFQSQHITESFVYDYIEKHPLLSKCGINFVIKEDEIFDEFDNYICDLTNYLSLYDILTTTHGL